MGSVEIVKAETEVLEAGGPTLADLADRITHNHESGLTHAAAAVADWCAVGDDLLLARARHDAMQSRGEPGQWQTWVADHLPFPLNTANFYIRAARYRDVLEGHCEPITSMDHAKQILTGLPPAHSFRGEQKPPPGLVDHAKQLRSEGLSAAAVGELLGISASTVLNWTDPTFKERTRRASQRWKERQKSAAQALAEKEREQAIKRAVRKAGAAEQELYAMAERMQDVMGQAHREATDREKREHYALAGEHYRKMRDEIVCALGVS